MLLASLIFSALFAALAWKNLKWALALTVFGLPAYLLRFQVWFVPLTWLEAMILIAVAVWLMRIWQKKSWREIKFGPFFVPGLILLAAAGLSIVFSADKLAALGIFKAYFAEPLLFYLIFINIIKTEADRELIYRALGVSAFMIALVAVAQKFTGWWIPNAFWAEEATRRVTSVFGYPNAVGLYLGPIVVLLLSALIIKIAKTKEKKELKNLKSFGNLLVSRSDNEVSSAWLYLLTTVLSLAVIWWARSEGAVVAVGAALIVFLFAIKIAKTKIQKEFKKDNSLKDFGICFGMVIVAAVVIAATWTQAREKIVEKATFQDLSGQIRLAMWDNTWDMLKDGRLLTGAGLANYQSAIAPYHQEGIFFNRDKDPNFHEQTVNSAEYRATHWQPFEIYLYPHNILLNFWSETGLLGVLAFVWLVIEFCRQWWRALKAGRGREFLALALAMLVILVHGIVDVPYFKNDLSVLFWLVLGLSVCVEQDRQELSI